MEAPSRAIGKARLRGRVRFPAASAALVFALCLSPSIAQAGNATEQIRGTIDRSIGILKDPALAAKGRKEERRDLLRKEIAPAFDFGEMAKRSLGPNWRERTNEERDRFVALFRELLENSYLGKIESYQGEAIRYGKETVDGPYAEVKTVVVTSKGQEFSVDYRMLEDGGRYRIYDVVIEGISLVGNYRSQFNSILQKSSFGELMDKLRATIQGQQP